MRTLHAVLPNDIDDPSAPSGGNRYDREICRGLSALGWLVHEHAMSGTWPQPERADRTELGRVLAGLDDHSVVLLDGLVASVVPDLLAAHATRLRLVALVHMPLGDTDQVLRPGESEALTAVAAVVTTSHWTRRRLIQLYGLSGNRVHVAPPGVANAAIAHGSAAGTRLLCVAAVTAHKGHDVLIEALATVPSGEWTCQSVGSLQRERDFADRVRRLAHGYGIADRISFVGTRTGPDLDACFAEADLLVLPTRGEAYGMVVTEALARGIPVVATSIGGLPEALGRASDGSLPGMLVPPEDAAALADAIRRWLGDPELRSQLRASARDRRNMLSGWTGTSLLVSHALSTTVANVSVR